MVELPDGVTLVILSLIHIYITTTVTETVTPSRTPPPEGAIVIAAASVGAVGVIVELLPRVACAFAGPLSGACTVLAPA